MFDRVIGIDPGSSGGIAVWTGKNIGSSKMPTLETVNGKGKKSHETDIESLGNMLTEQKEQGSVIVFMEKVQAWMSDTDENPGKRFRIQKMLANYESLKAVIKMLHIPMIEVPSRTWQTYLNLVRKGMSKDDRKRLYKSAAKEYYPTQDVALWNADALCLVQFGRMKLFYDKPWINERISKPKTQMKFT